MSENTSGPLPPATDTGEADRAPTARRPRLVRWWAAIVLPLAVGGIWLAAWLGGDALLAGRVAATLDGLRLDRGETAISASLLGGSVALDDAALSTHHAGETRVVYASDRTAIDLAVLPSLLSGDAVIAECTATDVRIDLRRFRDGSVAFPPPRPAEDDAETEAPSEDPPGIDRHPAHLADWLLDLNRWYQRGRRYLPSDDAEEPAPPPSQPAPRWHHARQFHPRPTPGDPGMPRLVIRSLAISGTAFALGAADSEDPLPLAITDFALDGSDLALRLAADETLRLAGRCTTVGAGTGTFAVTQRLDGGSASGALGPVPLAALADPRIAGPGLQRYGPSGSAELGVDATWSTTALAGTVSVTVTDLALDPDAEAGAEAAELARAVERLRDLHRRLERPFTLTWTLQLGGTPAAPRLVDLGADGFRRALAEVAEELRAALEAAAADAVDAAGERALEEGRSLLQDLEDGRDPADALRERGDRLDDADDAVERGTDKLKNLFGR